MLTLLGGAPLSPHEAPQLDKSGKGLLFSRDAPPPQRVSDVVSCGWFPAAWGPSLSPFRGSFSLEGRSFAPSRTGPITHLPPCGMAPSQDSSPSFPRGIEAGLRLTHRPSPSKGQPCREPAPSPEANNQVALLGWGTGQGAAGLAGTPAFSFTSLSQQEGRAYALSGGEWGGGWQREDPAHTPGVWTSL